jgi:hypothetical protein
MLIISQWCWYESFYLSVWVADLKLWLRTRRINQQATPYVYYADVRCCSQSPDHAGKSSG